MIFDTVLIVTPFYFINRYHALLYEPFRYKRTQARRYDFNGVKLSLDGQRSPREVEQFYQKNGFENFY